MNDRTDELEEAIRLADSRDDVAEGIRLRQQLVEASFSGSRPDIGLVAFAWMRAHMDWDDFGLVNGYIGCYFLIAQSVTQFPEISLSQIDQVLSDMDSDYVRLGDDREAVSMMRLLTAIRLGDCDLATRAMDRWREDLLKFGRCGICVTDLSTHFLLVTGQETLAVERAWPVAKDMMPCEEVHCNISIGLPCRLLVPLWNAGMHQEAEACKHNVESKLIDQADLSLTAGMLEYLALSRQLSPAISLIEQSFDESQRSSKQWYSYFWHLSAGLVLRACLAEGRESVSLALPNDLPDDLSDLRQPAGDSTELLVKWFDNRADELAEAFDRRNGNTWHADWAKTSRQRIACG